MLRPIPNPRVFRSRAEALEDAADRLGAGFAPRIVARRLVQVYDGGSIPTEPDRVYLTHPAELDGDESEGGAATLAVDTATTVPVVVLNRAAVAGDVLTAYAVGGRWVSEVGGAPSGTGYPCGSCTIPRQDLTVSWTNPIFGDGSTTLVYAGSPSVSWSSACSNQLLYELACTGGLVEFRVTYFLTGVCPTGQASSASTLGTNPHKLTQVSLVCGSAFLLVASVTSAGSPSLSANGYTGFTVSV